MPYNKIQIDKQRQLTKKKNRVCLWNPWRSESGSVYRIEPDIKGKIDRPKFWSISIIPNPVPNSFGGTTIGTVGTTIVQKIDTQIPKRKTGIQATKLDYLIEALVSISIIKA